SPGTERIEETLVQLFPGVEIDRLDRDSVTSTSRMEAILRRFKEGKTKILVGTQMVAKGHDIPGVTLVGVLDADIALGLPDFRSAEKTAQLLCQVAGRAGRGDSPGHVILQTKQPEHYALR
ncbi:MAG: helicase-related protein, partial [Planctomycetota bacterium]